MAENTFSDVSGQLVAGGMRVNPTPSPVIAFEAKSDRTVYSNLAKIQGLIPKISDVIIHEPKIWQSPREGLITPYGHPYGVALEQAAFVAAPPNKKKGDGCVPVGNAQMNSQLNIINFGQNVDISVYDREIDHAVMDESQAGAYFGAKMRLPMKRMASTKYLAELQLVSDVVDGTRSYASHSSSDGTGAAVTYNPTIEGWCGQVEHWDDIVPAPTDGSVVAFADAADVTDAIKRLQAVARDFKRETDAYNLLGIQTFCESKPTLIMESKTLDAMDNIMALDGTDKRFPTRDAREYIETFASIVEVPQFAALPTASATAKRRLGGVLVYASDWMFEDLKYTDMESMRCVENRMTGYNYQYESTIGIWKGADSFAFTWKTE